MNFEERLNAIDSKLSIEMLGKASTDIRAFVRSDDWQNVMTGLGINSKDHRKHGTFSAGRPIEPMEYEAMYLEDPYFAKIVDTPADYATKEWIDISGGKESAEDFGSTLLDELDRLDTREMCRDVMRYALLDGGAVIILGANDGNAPDVPLNMDTIATVDFLHVMRRQEITPIEIDRTPTSRTFRQPLFYMPANTSARIHASRVIRVRGIWLSDLISSNTSGSMSPLYWGVPIAQRVGDALRDYHSVMGHIGAAFKDLSQAAMGVKGLAEILATEKGNENLIKRLTLVALTASSFNAVLFDPEFESYEKKNSTTMGGVAEVIDRVREHLAGVSEIPITKLFGTTPAGFSTDDKSGERTFCASIAVKQDRMLRKPIRRIAEVVMAAKEGPIKKIPKGWGFKFNAIEERNRAEEATTRKTEAETDAIHLANGVLTEAEIRTRLANDPENPYTLDDSVTKAIEALGTKSLEEEPDQELEGELRD